MLQKSSSKVTWDVPEQISRLGRLLNGGTGLVEVLEEIAVAAAELAGGDHSDITLFDPMLRRVVPPRSRRVFMHQGDEDAADWVRENRTQLLVPDVTYVAAENDLTLYNRDIASYIGIPIFSGGHVEGALLVFCRMPRSFEDGEAEVLELLASMAGTAITRHRLQHDFEEASRILLRLSLTDPATGVATLHQYEQMLAREWHRALAEGLPLAVMQVEVHVKADPDNEQPFLRCSEAALARTARLLHSSLYRAGDVIARVGDRRLALLLPETDEAGAMAIARRLRRDVAQMLGESGEGNGRISLLIGVSSYDSLQLRRGPRFTPVDLDQQAAAALELASAQGEGDQLQALSLL